MEFKVRLLKFIFLFCLQVSFVDAVTDHQNFLSYLCSFFYKNNQWQLKNKVLSFDERLTLFGEQFKDVLKSADFDIRIMALQTRGCTHQECLEYIDQTKLLLQKNYSLKNSFYEVYAAQGVNKFLSQCHLDDQHESYLDLQEKRSADEKLYDAYHEAGHAAALILSDDKLVALSYVTIKSQPHCAQISLLPYFDYSDRPVVCSDDDFINHKKNNLQQFLSGGIGEQLFKVPCDLRISEDFDQIDKNHERYDFLECTSRTSVGQDFDDACEIAEFIVRWNHNNFDKDFVPCAKEKTQVLLQSYQAIRPKLEQHKDSIEKLTHRLVEKKTVDADEAYEIFGKQRPKFYFEQ